MGKRVSSFALDLGNELKREDLKPPHTLIQLFKDLRNTLAGRSSGVTLDQILVSQLIDLIACKVYDEFNTPIGTITQFQVFPKEDPFSLYRRLNDLFQEVRSNAELGQLFSHEELNLEPDLLSVVVGKLQALELTNAGRDAIGEAFEVFIGTSIRGNEGQFFTPRNVVNLACSVINPRKGEVVLDPACGTGGFLLQALRNYEDKGYIAAIGVDKDSFLARIAGIQLILMRGKHKTRAFNADSLHDASWSGELNKAITKGSVDAIITNPPFGAKINVNPEVLVNLELGKQWKRNRKTEEWSVTDSLVENRPPQVLFVEQCLSLLRPGGRCAIVLPDGILGNENLGFVRQYVRAIADIVAIFDLPLETFMPSTSTKTSLLVLRKKNGMAQESVFMAIPQKCGHDRRGKEILNEDGNPDDDLSAVAQEFLKWSESNAPDFFASK